MTARTRGRGIHRAALSGLAWIAAATAIAQVDIPQATERVADTEPLIYVLEKDGSALISPQPAPPYLDMLESIGIRVHLSAGTEWTRALTWEQLKQYPMVVMTHYATVHGNKRVYEDEDALAELLDRYLRAGGSILYLGVEHMSHWRQHDEVNRWLKRYDLQLQWATVDDAEHAYTDPPNLPYQTDKVIWTTNISEHPATANTETLFMRNRVFYAPFLRPLVPGKDWTVLVRSMPTATTTQLQKREGGSLVAAPVEGSTSKPHAVPLLAVRQVGKGRLAVFAHNPGPFWYDLGKPAIGAVCQGNGDGQRRSDWYPLLRGLTEWLTEPARAQGFPGGASGKQAFHIKPDWGTRLPIDWEKPDMAWTDDDVTRLYSVHSSLWTTDDWHQLLAGAYPSFKILVGARTALSGGKGRVDDWKRAAVAAGFDGVAFREDILNLTRDQWEAFQAECRAASDARFVAMPGQQFKTIEDSAFMRFNLTIPYHTQERLNHDGTRVLNQLHWFFDCLSLGPPETRSRPVHFPLKVQANTAPWWSYRAYNSLPVYIYEDGQILEQNREQWEQLIWRYEYITPMALHLLDDPAQVADAADQYNLHLIAPSLEVLQNDPRWRMRGLGCGHPFNTAAFLSNGPRIQAFQALAPFRTTLGSREVDGSYRHRLYVRASSEEPIERIEIISDGRPLRVLRPGTKRAYYEIDGLHDEQRGLYLRVVDTAGREALATSFHVHDKMIYLQWCGDHCNILGGGCGVNEAGEPSSFGVPTHVKLRYAPMAGPGANGGEAAMFIPYGTDTASPALGLMGKFRLHAAEGPMPANRYEPVPDTCMWYGNRNLRLHRLQVRHVADREYWLGTDEDGRRRYNSGYLSAWGSYFTFEPYEPFTLVHDDIDFLQNYGQPAFQWCRGKVTFHAPVRVENKGGYELDLIQLKWGAADGFHVPGQSISQANTGGLVRQLKRGEWVTFTEPMGHGSLIPLDDRVSIRASMPPDGKSSMFVGYELGDCAFEPGDELEYSFLLMRWPLGLRVEARLEQQVVDMLGLGDAPGYAIRAVQGAVRPNGFGFAGEPSDGAFVAELPRGDLGMRMPLRLTGYAENCTIGVLRAGSRHFEPLAPDDDGVLWATFDPVADAGRLFIGHPVLSDTSEVIVEVYQTGKGAWNILAHNPTDRTHKTRLRGTAGGPLPTFRNDSRLVPGETRRWSIDADH